MSIAAAEEQAIDGVRLPTGWRIDTFGKRQVSVPPWSRRPPWIEPETWIMTAKKQQEVDRTEWKEKDPDSFLAQERRLQTYNESKSVKKQKEERLQSPAQRVTAEAARTQPPLPVRCRQPGSMLHFTVSLPGLLTVRSLMLLSVQSSCWSKLPLVQQLECE